MIITTVSTQSPLENKWVAQIILGRGVDMIIVLSHKLQLKYIAKTAFSHVLEQSLPPPKKRERIKK